MEIVLIVLIGIIGFSVAQLAETELLPLWGLLFLLATILIYSMGL